jgi:hypothetical protein
MFPAVRVGTVMKVQARSAASAFPSTSLAAVVTVAVTRLLPGSRLEGVNVAVSPEQLTVPATAIPPMLTVKELAVMLAGAIGLLKTAVMVEA